MKENPDRAKKQNKKVNSALWHVRTDFQSMMGEERLNSFMAEVPIIKKPVHWFAEQSNGPVSIRQGTLSWKS